MAIDSILPPVLTLLQPAIPTLDDALHIQPCKCFAPIARRLEAYGLQKRKNEFRGAITTDAGKRHDNHPHLAQQAALQGNYADTWLQVSTTSWKLSIPGPCWRTTSSGVALMEV